MKLSIIAMTAVMVAPLAMATTPMTASAKTYKISKNVLNHKNKYMAKNISGGIVLRPRGNKKIQIFTIASRSTSSISYRIVSQRVSGSKLIMKLDGRQIKTNYYKDYGTLMLQRTGKNTYKIPHLYRGTYSGEFHLSGHKFYSFGRISTAKSTSLKGLKVTSKASLVKTDFFLKDMLK